MLFASFGSFFLVVVDRYNTEKSAVFFPSHCLSCSNKLNWWHNIPVFSYLILRGKCFFCKKSVEVRYLLAEIFSGVLLLSVFIFIGNSQISNLFTLSNLLFSMVLILLTFFDFKHRIVPHTITYCSITFLLLFSIPLGGNLQYSIMSLGVAFLGMDFIYFIATVIQRYKVEENALSIAVFIWLFISVFCLNIYLVAIPIIIGLGVQISNKKIIKAGAFWFLSIIILIGLLYKALIFNYNLEILRTLFLGIGLIYLFNEILFYLVLTLTPFVQIDEDDEESPKYAIGGGDITIIALISAYLGYKYAFLTLFFASLLALVSQLVLKLVSVLKKQKSSEDSKHFPFVPYICFACFIIIFMTRI